MISEKSILSGIRRKYLLTYLQSICTTTKNDRYFFGEGWEIELLPEVPRNSGSITLTQTHVIFRGTLEIIDPIIYHFRMEFLSAGG